MIGSGGARAGGAGDRIRPSELGLSAVAFLTVIVIFIGELSTPREISLASLAVVPAAVTAWFAPRAYRPLLAFAVVMTLLAAAVGSISYQTAAAVGAACIAMTIVIRVGVRGSFLIERRDASGASSLPSLEVETPANGDEIAHAAVQPRLAAVSDSALRKPLTDRERQVVELATAGLTAREIGARLFIGDRTVETHLANSYAKLGITSKRELIQGAYRNVS